MNVLNIVRKKAIKAHKVKLAQLVMAKKSQCYKLSK